jgi:hypothetical protein
MAASELQAAGEALEAMRPEELIALIIQLRGINRAQEQTLAEVIDERDAALMLNELCHY